MIGSIVSLFVPGKRLPLRNMRLALDKRESDPAGITAWFVRWHTLRRSRRALDRLTEWELRDIGLSRHQARNEYRKSLFID